MTRARVERPVLFVAIGLGLVYGIQRITSFWSLVGAYAGIPIGITPQEVVYLQGPPTHVSEGGRLWRAYAESHPGDRWIYEAPAHRQTITFDKGRVARSGCAGRAGETDCPPVYDTAIGDDEFAVLRRLGPPDHEYIVHGHKVMDYAHLGFTFTLEQAKVAAIESSIPKNHAPGLLRGLFYWALP